MPDISISLASATSPAQQADESNANQKRADVKVGSKLARFEPDEDAAKHVEDKITHELSAGDADAEWELIRDPRVDIHPNRSEANVERS